MRRDNIPSVRLGKKKCDFRITLKDDTGVAGRQLPTEKFFSLSPSLSLSFALFSCSSTTPLASIENKNAVEERSNGLIAPVTATDSSKPSFHRQ